MNKEQSLEYGIVEKNIAYHIDDHFIFLITGVPEQGKEQQLKILLGSYQIARFFELVPLEHQHPL